MYIILAKNVYSNIGNLNDYSYYNYKIVEIIIKMIQVTIIL